MRLAPAFILILSVVPASAEPPRIEGAFQFGSDVASDASQSDIATLTTFQYGGALVTGRLELGRSHVGDREASYASAGLGLPFASIDVGRPRSIFEVGPLPTLPRYGSTGLREALRPIAAEAALSETLGTGVRVSGEAGAWHLGTSVHWLEDIDESVVGVAGRLDVPVLDSLDQFIVYGGAETDGTEDRFLLGTEVTWDAATAAIDLVRSDSDAGFLLSQLSVGYEMRDGLTLGVSGSYQTDDLTDEGEARFGLGAAYSLDTGAVWRGGIEGADSQDYSLDVTIGFEF
ncbi:MAG: hypothetical protein GKR98_04545 [Boseongicola sp.]|nr:MAG: hypothetical protein GKR98_04545 [Boseongicola sp.]